MVQKILRLSSAVYAVSMASVAAATLFTTSTFDTGQEGWAGGASPMVINRANPHLQVSSEVGSLATFNTSEAWAGDFEAAGINGVTVELRGPASNSEPLAIRATLLGPGTNNRWVTEPFTVPADGIWRTASFDFTEASMTRIVGTASFAETLASVNRVLFRHDPGTPSQQGDPVTGTLDLDTIRSVPEPGAGLLVALAGGAWLFPRRRSVGIAAVAIAIAATLGTSHAAEPDPLPKKVFVFSRTGWYRHPEIPSINGWLARFLHTQGIEAHITETPSDLEKLLPDYDVLVMNNSNTLDKILSEKQRKSVETWYASGKGIVALHAVLVRQDGWPWIQDLGGCDFDSDSEFLEAKVVIDPDALNHPAVKGHGASFLYTADWTNHTRSVTGLPGVQVLLRVDESTYEPVRERFADTGKAMGADHPIAWTRTYGGGRFFYTELGHDVRSLDTAFGKQHLTEAIRWVYNSKK